MFHFTKQAEKEFRKLEPRVQEGIIKKLQQIKNSGNFLQLDTLKDFLPATHRLRIGEYRLVLSKNSESSFLVIDCKHRKDIYR